MSRLSRVAWSLSLLAGVVAAGTAFTASSGEAKATHRSGSAVVTIGNVAAQLGVKVASRTDEDFTVGSSFTGTLDDPEKLAAFGIKGMHLGARVTAVRMATDRVYVEADELEPPARGSARLRLDSDGNLVPAPKA